MLSTNRTDQQRLLALLHAAEIGASVRGRRAPGPALTRKERQAVRQVLEDAFGPFVSTDHRRAPMVNHRTVPNAQIAVRAGAFQSAARRREIQQLLARVSREPESPPLPTWFKLSTVGVMLFVAMLAELQSRL